MHDQEKKKPRPSMVGYPLLENNSYLNENPPEPIPHISSIPLTAHLRTITPPTFTEYIPVPPVPFWSCLHKRRKFNFGFTRLFDLSMKYILQNSKEKGLRIPSTTNLMRYIVYHSRLSTLAANNEHQNSSNEKTYFDR